MVCLESYLPFGRPEFGDGEIDAVARVLRSGWVGMGAETLAFESELAAACDAPAIVTVNSCTSALFLSLLVTGVGPGDEVVVPSLTWISTANVVRHLGATPVFCDVSSDTFGVTPDTVRAALSPRTRAIVPVHYGGLALDVDAIRRVVPNHITIVEDAAHAWGAHYADGRPVGASGNLTCFSFYANKNLSTGDGGAVAVANDALAHRLRSLRQHALPQDAWKRFIDPRRIEKPAVTDLGFKMNYTDLQAAVGRVQLRRQSEFHARRLAIAREYVAALDACPWPVTVQADVLLSGHARHLFVVRLPVDEVELTRDDVLVALRARNIGASLHYQPVHTMPLYAGSRPVSLPVTETLAAEILTLPISASMSVGEAQLVANGFREVLASAPSRRAAVSVRRTAAGERS